MRPIRFIIPRSLPFLLAISASILLGACGTRGSLTQLPVPAQRPILERWSKTPAPPPSVPQEELSRENAGESAPGVAGQSSGRERDVAPNSPPASDSPPSPSSGVGDINTNTGS